MKKLILILVLAITTIAVYGQTTYTFSTYNPLEITAPDNTNTHIVQCPRGETEVLIKFPSGNAGTVKVNVASSTMTGTGISTFSNTTDPNGIILNVTSATGYRIHLLFSNTGDKAIITKWRN